MRMVEVDVYIYIYRGERMVDGRKWKFLEECGGWFIDFQEVRYRF